MSDQERIHIYPVNDIKIHNTSAGSCYCGCQPSLIEYPDALMIIHNAYDAREFYDLPGVSPTPAPIGGVREDE